MKGVGGKARVVSPHLIVSCVLCSIIKDGCELIQDVRILLFPQNMDLLLSAWSPTRHLVELLPLQFMLGPPARRALGCDWIWRQGF